MLTTCGFQLLLGRVYTFYSPKYIFMIMILVFVSASTSSFLYFTHTDLLRLFRSLARQSVDRPRTPSRSLSVARSRALGPLA